MFPVEFSVGVQTGYRETCIHKILRGFNITYSSVQVYHHLFNMPALALLLVSTKLE